MKTLLERPPDTGRRASLALELTLYIAAILVAVGSAFIIEQFWDDLGSPGQLAIGATVMVVGYTAARSMARTAPGALDRPAALMRVVGAGGAAIMAGVIAHWSGADAPETIGIVVGPVVLVAGFADWRNRERLLGFLTTAVGVVTTGLAAGGLLHLGPRVAGATTWAVATVVLAGAITGRVHPAGPAAVLSTLASFVGITVFTDHDGRLGILATLAVLAMILAVGLVASSTPTIATAGALFAITLPRALAAYLQGVGAAIGMLLVGVVVLALVVPRLVARAGGRPPRPPSDASTAGA